MTQANLTTDDDHGLGSSAHNTAFDADSDRQVARIDRSLEREMDDAERGTLLLDRALINQGSDHPEQPAADAREALRLLRASGASDEASLAGAIAAGLTFRTGDIETAVDFAVESMVLFDGYSQSTHAARAANAVAVLFEQLSAFQFAYDHSLKALELLGDAVDATRAIISYSLCTIVVNARRAGVDLPLDTAVECADWLSTQSSGRVPRGLLGPGMSAELEILRSPDRIADIDLDDAFVAEAAPRLAGWFCVVLAEIELERDSPERAAARLDQTIPVLVATGDEHRLSRAYSLRSRARAELGDLTGALADSNERNELVDSWHVQQVGRLAVQIMRRAEVERARASLQLRANELAEEVDLDALTGVGSRRFLDMSLDAIADHGDVDVAIVMVDLDHFKAVNDAFGHAVGDIVLRQVGEILRDAAQPTDLVTRFGGEEFVVVLPGATDDRALRYADEVRALLTATNWTHVASDFGIRASAGIASGPPDQVRAVMELADAALYRAKRQGRDRAVIA